ncbi:hypothetical protein C8R46DRAFT_1343925 [Mycena filopes]|nr:hypothetical protein C8R46DRAFT_1343925 [Mycena filopes]
MSPPPHHVQDILAISLNDPLNSNSLCIHGLLAAVVAIMGCHIEGIPYQVDALRAGMKFMTTRRSESEHVKLRTRLISCHCNMYNPKVHWLHNNSTAPPCTTISDKFEMTIFYLCKVLATAIENFDPKRYDTASRWPRTIEDLTPFGAEPPQLCDAILGWTAGPAAPGSYAVFTLLGGLATIYRSFAKHIHTTPALFTFATAQLERALANYPTHDVDALLMPRFSAPVLSCAGNFFQRLRKIDAARADGMLAATLPVMHDIALRMQTRISATGSEMKYCRSWFTFVCKRVNGGVFVPRGPAVIQRNSGSAYPAAAWTTLVTMRTTKCTFEGCQLRTVPKSLHICAGCGVARYCSQEHQRMSWKSPERPHKPMCTAIKALREALGMQDNKAWTNLIYDPEAGRALGVFDALYERHQVDPILCKAVLEANGCEF